MPKRLLVVDDEPQLCKALGALFAEKGFRVTTASTAHEALASIDRVRADLVLLDLKLPDGSGLDVLSTLKTRFPDLRVVVISALTDQPTIREAMDRGASDYLAKPFDFTRCFYVAMGLETVDFAQVQPEPSALSRIPADVARRCQVLPMRWDEDALHVAVADPLDERQISELSALLQCPIKPIAVIRGDLTQAIRRSYGVETATAQPPQREAEPAQERHAVGPSPEVLALMRAMVEHAHEHRATDLHVGHGPKGPWVRERIDGMLDEVPPPASLNAHYAGLVAYLKGLAHLDAASRALPQQGRMTLELGTATLTLSLSVMPTAHEEHLVIRLAEPARALSFERLGMSQDQRLAAASLLAKPSGVLLVTGPAGSGTSTSLYAFLAKLNTGQVNIVTLEDPVERDLAGVTQIPISPTAGLTFADGLRAISHHDPDVVMVGELRDPETASLAVREALTGRLVLSRLHTHDASSAITRLLDYGIEPFFLCSTLSGILAQRLVRTLCAACREPYEVEAASLGHLGVSLAKDAGAIPVWRAKGCERCRDTGYHGRTGIFELLVVDSPIRALIIKRTSGIQIRQSAISRGMVSLPQALWHKVQTGTTSLEELIRFLSPDRRSPDQH